MSTSSSSSSPWSFRPSAAALGRMTDLSPAVRTHLRRVYLHLSLMVGSAAAGAYAVLWDLWQASQLTFFASLACLIGFQFIPPTKENESKRKALLLAFSFLQGLSLGPLLELTLYINPAIVTVALIATTLVFVCFTLSAVFAPRRSLIYAGGILGSMLSVLLLMNFANAFVGSRALGTAELWLGTGVFALYIAYDSQVIIEKAELGSRDYLTHSLTLFVDAVNLFSRVLVILGKKEERKKREERKRR